MKLMNLLKLLYVNLTIFWISKNNIDINYTFIKDDKFMDKMLNWKYIRDIFTNEINDFILESNINIIDIH